MTGTANTFGGNTPTREEIESSMVCCENLPHSNRKFGHKYYGQDKDLVVKRANQAVARMDSYRSPSASEPYQDDDNWCVDVTWYSVD